MGTPTKQNIDILRKYDINYLYHMTSVHNMDSIIRHGLLSHNEAYQRELIKRDISSIDVQNKRHNKFIDPHYLHDYVSLYFSPRNPMLCALQNIQEEIVILCISPKLVFNENIIFSDGNAASASTTFFTGVDSLEQFPWQIIHARFWPDHEDGKRIKCAEILVYPKIPTSLIMKIYCCNQRTKISCVKMVNQKIPVEINYFLYF